MTLIAVRHGDARIIESEAEVEPGDLVIAPRHITHVRTEERERPEQLWFGTTGHAEIRARHDDALVFARKLAGLMREEG